MPEEEVLKIRCSPELRRTFKSFCAALGVKYEDGLDYLLDKHGYHIKEHVSKIAGKEIERRMTTLEPDRKVRHKPKIVG